MKIPSVMFLFSFAAASMLNAANLIGNGDFKSGTKDFGFSDAAPEKLGIKIESLSDSSNALTYTAEADGLGGLNMSEVNISPDGAYTFSFKAKASKPVKIRLIALANGNTIYRYEIAKFDISTDWKTYSHKLDLKKMMKAGVDVWIPFRFEKVSKEKVDLSFADIRLEGDKPKGQADLTGISVELKPSITAVGKIKNRLSGKVDSGAPIYDKNAEIELEIAGINSEQSPKKLSFNWKIKNIATDQYVSEGGSEIEIPAGSFGIESGVAAPSENGIYNLETTLGGNRLADKHFAVSPKVRTGTGVLPIDTGYCGVLTNGEQAKPTPEEMAFLADTGISYIRTWDSGNPFNWRVLEPKEGEYFWEITDETVRLARKNGLKVLPVLGGMFFVYPPEMGLRGHRQADWLYAKSEVSRAIPGFEAAGRMAINPPLEDWERMVEAVGRRYKGKIRQYEIMNEPNIIWRDYSTYYRYLESAHKVLKKIDKRNKVVGFSTTGDYGGHINGFLATLLKMGAGKFSDVISFHSYSSLYEDSPKRGDEVIAKFKKNLAECKLDVPLWHTELYYLNPLCKGGGDHETGPIFHAGYLIRRYLVDASQGVRAAILLPASFVANKSSGECKLSNFAKGRYIPYQSVEKFKIYPNFHFIASAVFAQNLYNTKFANARSFPNRMLAYEFVGKKSEHAVATLFALDCHMENLNKSRNNLKSKVVDKLGRKPVNLGKLPSGIEIENIYGNKIKADANGDTIIPVSPIPVYIKAENKGELDAFLDRLDK